MPHLTFQILTWECMLNGLGGWVLSKEIQSDGLEAGTSKYA